MSHERRILYLALGAGLPGSATALAIFWTGAYSPKVQWTFTVLILSSWLGFAFAARERTILPLQTLANLLEALREGDYSIRARDPGRGDALGEVMLEVNALGELLRSQRFHAVDATQLLETVIEEIDIGLFAFDEAHRLRLVNRAGERLMAQPSERLLGRSAEDLGLDDCLVGEATRTFERSFPGQSGRWQCRRTTFREAGEPQQLLVLSDLSKALREEERQAWQRLIRVLGHELNNSLAPIKSTASTLAGLLRREEMPEDWKGDARRGLGIIAARCDALTRFVAAYSKLARLPSPTLQPTPVGPLVRRVASLENRRRVDVEKGSEIAIRADPDQLEQLLINLVKNAVEAAEETGGEVRVSWRELGGDLEIEVIDGGPGLPPTSNLFVPFFTTKPEGTGIGLVLCRQIAEAHGGTLILENRDDTTGCLARLRLPLGRTGG